MRYATLWLRHGWFASMLAGFATLLALVILLPTYAQPAPADQAPGRQASVLAPQALRYQSVTTKTIGELDTIDNTIAVTGTLAFVGSRYQYRQSSLGVMDISDPARIARHRLLPLDVQKIQFVGRYAFVATVDVGLQIFDVSDPISPTLTSSLRDFGGTGRVEDLQVVGGTAYVLSSKQSPSANGSVSTLWVIDVAQPQAPIVLGNLPLLAYSTSLRVSGTRAYVDQVYIPLTGSGPGFGIIDISDPTNPTPLVAYSTNYPGFDAAGTLVYVAAAGTFAVIDTAVASTPVVRSSTPISSTGGIVTLQGDTAYVLATNEISSSLTILDVAHATQPVLLSSTSLLHPTCLPYVAATRFFAMCSDGLNVFDVTNPQQPALLGRYTVPKNVRRVQVIGDRAYLFEQPPPNVSLPVFSDPCPWGGNKLWIVDIANAAVPRPIGSYAFGNPCVDLLGIVAQRAYFADQNTIKIVNISTETNPFLETTVAMPVAGTAVQLVGSRAYVINDTRFFIVDISVPTSPMLLGTYNANEQVYSLRVAGSLAYMTTGSSFKVLDVSIPTRPILLNGAAPLIAYGTMEIVGQRVYLEYESGGALSGSSIGFTTLDVGRPEQPTILATYLSANRVWSYADSSSGRVRVANGLAFIVSGSPNQDSWQIVDITDEAHPRSVGRYRSVGKPHDAQVVGNRFYVVNAGGFQILDFIATMCECSDVYLPLVHA